MPEARGRPIEQPDAFPEKNYAAPSTIHHERHVMCRCAGASTCAKRSETNRLDWMESVAQRKSILGMGQLRFKA